MVPLELVGVRVEVPGNTPMLLLREQESDHRLLPIYIGNAEASAIHYALEGVEPPRPFTHDLFVSTLSELGAEVVRVVITDMREHTFFAELHVRSGERDHVISSRPSDAIALAVRCGAPLFADSAVLDEHGRAPEPETEPDETEIIDEFKDFLEHVDPGDFG